MNVIKRNGSVEELNMDKIYKMLEGASAHLDTPSYFIDKIMDKLILRIKNNIHVSEIQEQLINVTKDLIDVEFPEFSLIAGKLLMSQHIHSTPLMSPSEVYKKGVESGRYDSSFYLPDFYDVLQHIEVKNPHNYIYNYSSTTLWIGRYLQPNETPAMVFAFIASILAVFNEDGNKMSSSTYDFANEIYTTLASNKLSMGTPFLMNLRIKNGNLSSCFTSNVPDDMGHIFNAVRDFALVSKNGGGQGLYLGDLRAKTSMIKGVYGLADSVIPVSSVFNQTAIFSNQNGKRAGAVTLALPAWHGDILEFLELQTESGDIRRKAFDIFPQLIANDKFMEALDGDTDYPLVCPHEVKELLDIDLTNDEFPTELLIRDLKNESLQVGKVVRARSIFKSMVTALMVKGTPYVTFHDNIQRMNPAKDIGTIKTANLCVESFSVTNERYTHVCNLMSVVLPNVKDDELEDTVSLGIKILDLMTDFTTYPTLKAENHAQDFRVVGLGGIGLHDWLAERNLTFDSLDEIETLFEKVALYSHKASIQLAKERKPFKRYKESEFNKGIILGHDLDWFSENSNGLFNEWCEVFEDLKTHGIANLQMNAYMPSTSTSILMGVTAGMLPVYSKFFYDTSKLGSLPIFPRHLKEKFWYYKDYVNHDIIKMNTLIGKATKWIDTGISYEVTIDLDNTNIYDLLDFYVDAWKKGIKTIYYIRWVRGNKIDNKEECVSCAG